MADPTETIRREQQAVINTATREVNGIVGPEGTRALIEAEHGQVWDTSELSRDFDVLGFAAPLVVVRRKSDGQKGSLYFTHSPRFYYGFEPHKP